MRNIQNLKCNFEILQSDQFRFTIFNLCYYLLRFRYDNRVKVFDSLLYGYKCTWVASTISIRRKFKLNLCFHIKFKYELINVGNVLTNFKYKWNTIEMFSAYKALLNEMYRTVQSIEIKPNTVFKCKIYT